MITDKTIDQQYEDALDFLYSHLNFEVKAQDRYMANKLDPKRPFTILAALDNPQQTYPTIHIAGTKGKGSVAALCAAALQAAGLRVGLYTSPHLQDFRERIRILTADDPSTSSGGWIPKADFVDLMAAMKTAVSEIPGSTWFEIVSSLAFLHFARQQVDIAVIEVGLGGRLDSTNVITPLVSVISSLSIDHTKFLGDTIEQIAYEKGGIIKPAVAVVSASQPPAAMAKLQAIAHERQSPLTVIGSDWQYEKATATASTGSASATTSRRLSLSKAEAANAQTLCITKSASTPFIEEGSCFPLALRGAHQLENAAVALAALAVVQPHFPGLTADAVRAGFGNVVWNGRLQQLQTNPIIITDGAHNADSAQKLADALRDEFNYDNLHLVFAVSGDKNIAEMMAILFPMAASITVTRSTHPRAAVPSELATQAAEYPVTTAENLQEAMAMVTKTASATDLICVTGSLFIVGDLLNLWTK